MIAIGGTNIVKAYLGQTELANIAIGDELLLSSEPAPLPYDAEIEFLESTGTQYINTGFTNVGGCEIEVEYATTANSSGNTVAYGSRTNANTNTCASFSNDSTIILDFQKTDTNNNRISISIGQLGDRVKTVGTLSHGEIYVNGQLSISKNRKSSASFTLAQPLTLFKLNNTTWALSPLRLYHFKITKDSAALIDMIPVRVGTTGYMYDKVSKTLFGNAGTGDFVLGNDVI